MKGLVERVRLLLAEAKAHHPIPIALIRCFKFGDQAILRSADLHDPADVDKLRDLFTGPFPIVAVGPAPIHTR